MHFSQQGSNCICELGGSSVRHRQQLCDFLLGGSRNTYKIAKDTDRFFVSGNLSANEIALLNEIFQIGQSLIKSFGVFVGSHDAKKYN